MRRIKIPIISIPKPLREKLGEEGSDGLVQVLNEQGNEIRDSVIDIAESRFEKKLTDEISNLWELMIRSDHNFKEELQGSINSTREDMYKLHSGTVKCMFIFWIGQVGALLGILFAFFK
jgi:hypothetical protein